VLNNSFTPGTPTVKGLRAGIKAEGLEEGGDVRFDVRSTGAEDRTVAPLAAELGRENPDVIVAIGEKETRAAKAAAPETSVVFIQIPDPVAIGLVTSIARPGGRLTGIADLRTDLVPKRLELAKELMPNLRRVLGEGSGNTPLPSGDQPPGSCAGCSVVLHGRQGPEVGRIQTGRVAEAAEALAQVSHGVQHAPVGGWCDVENDVVGV
jgi:ABC transporter substrate binding protein